MYQPITLETTRAINRRMLLICPLMLVASIATTRIPNPGNDLVRALAYNAILVEMMIIYLPAHSFIEKRGGPAAFGFVKASAGEWMWALLFGVAAFFLSTALNGFTQYLWQLSGANLSVLAEDITVGGGWRMAAMAFLLGIIPPFAEETLFRGALLHAWLPRGKKRALWHTAVLFALVHLQPQALPALILLGLLLGMVALMTGSVYPSMAIHAVNNLMVVVLTYFSGAQTQAVSASAAIDAASLPVMLIYLAVGAAGCFACYRGIRRSAAVRRSRREEELLKIGELRSSAEEQVEASPKQTGRTAVVWTYILMGLVNALLLAAMFIKLPAGLHM